MKVRKSLVALLVIVLLSFTVAVIGCAEKSGNGEGDIKEKIVIGWTPPDTGVVWSTATEFFEKTAEEARKHGINVEVITQVPESHEAFADQINIVEDFIQRKVDVIAISPAEVEVLKPALINANKAGIPVIVLNMLEGIEGVEIACSIGFDNFKTAAAAGEIAAEHLMNTKGGGYIGIIEGIPGGFFSETRLQGFLSVIEEYPSIEVVGTVPGNWRWDDGVTAGEDLLTANPENLDIIYAASDNMALGAYEAIKRAGREDEVRLVTQNGTWESIEAVRDGILLGDVWHGFPEWGHYGVKYAVMLALGLGEQVPAKHDVGAKKIMVENYQEFYPEPHLEPIDWEWIKEEAAKLQN